MFSKHIYSEPKAFQNPLASEIITIQSFVHNSPFSTINKQETFFSIFSSNSEASASELLENIERKFSSVLHAYQQFQQAQLFNYIMACDICHEMIKHVELSENSTLLQTICDTLCVVEDMICYIHHYVCSTEISFSWCLQTTHSCFRIVEKSYLIFPWYYNNNINTVVISHRPFHISVDAYIVYLFLCPF